MHDLVSELERCQADTARLLPHAVGRLANWQQYADDKVALIKFVQKVIRVEQNRQNGWDLHKKGGRSLEQIVIDCGTTIFSEEDIRIAKETLGV